MIFFFLDIYTKKDTIFFLLDIYTKKDTKMTNIKLKKLLKENMRRFGTKNLNESPDPSYLQFAKKASYNNSDDIMSAAEDLADELIRPKMEDLPIVQHAIQQMKRWTDRKKPAPYSVYALVQEAPALLDKMQARSKNAWQEMRSHLGGIVDAYCDEDEDEYVTEYQPDSDDLI